mgnify:CR=1 FL=1
MWRQIACKQWVNCQFCDIVVTYCFEYSVLTVICQECNFFIKEILIQIKTNFKLKAMIQLLK